MRGLAAFFIAAVAVASAFFYQEGGSKPLLITGEDAGYLPPSACDPCHRAIAESYRRTGMGRSFFRPTPENTTEDYSRNNQYFHPATGQHYTMTQRGGRYYQRRHELDAAGRETNIVENEIRFVLGSGTHARTYLLQTPGGQLAEAPVAWYSENGGFWAMNPGYDRHDHFDFRRKIDRECFFCHNAYPAVEAGIPTGARELFLRGAIPEGIDCQRCHGPGRAHVQRASNGAPVADVRAAIVNPARLAPERRLEVCLQCHLESTSRRLPYSLRRYGRAMFSYRAGQPLEDYILHFDHAPGAGQDDKFEISGAAYRLMKSACFLKSDQALTCTTCHDPHVAETGEAATRRYIKVCQGCHAAAHRATENCVSCHMPRRRTDDVVHVVMTDHYIQRRRPDRDLLAPLLETHDDERTRYRGEVVPLYPRRLPAGGEGELYIATAQVVDDANLAAGIPRLRRAIETYHPARAEFYVELAGAYARSGRNEAAIPYYEEALRRDPHDPAARRNYAAALTSLGRLAEAANALEPAEPGDAVTLNALGAAWLNLGRFDRALAVLRRALRNDADLPEIYANLGTALLRSGDLSAAAGAFQSALRASPASTAAHSNLATIFQKQGDFEQAEYHFKKAIWSDPEHAVPHYNYGRALAEKKMFPQAESELRAALALDPRFAEAAAGLGLVLAQTAQPERAVELYRRAIEIKPGLSAAHFNLGLALLGMGKGLEAKPHFQAVLRSEPGDDSAHLYLGKILLAEGERAAAVTHLEKASKSSNRNVRNAALDALRAAGEKK
jgi:predicted CXXCH cytochrome family protein